MARRKSAAGPARVDITPGKREYQLVYGGVSDESAHPFGPGRPCPDFESWCLARQALVDSLDSFGLTTEDFQEV